MAVECGRAGVERRIDARIATLVVLVVNRAAKDVLVAVLEHEEQLTGYGVDRLSRISGLQLLGAGQRRLGILSFDLEGVHPHDLAQVLDQHHVAVRAGHHCAQPLLESLGYPATTRASLGVYNDERDIDRLAEAIETAREMFRR